MTMWIMPPVSGLIEPTAAPVYTIDGIGAIALADGILTTYYYLERPNLFGQGTDKTLEVIIKRPSYRAIEGLAQCAKIAEFLLAPLKGTSDERPPPGGFKPQLVR